MAILDQFGRQISYKAARAAQDTRYRPYEPVEKKDISDLVPSLDRVTLQSHARRIYLNFGPIKNAINQRGMYAVGRAFVPIYTGGDEAFGMAATKFLTDIFYPIGDGRGGMHDLKTNLFGFSTSIDVDGEIFILLTETATGFPQYQGIPSHRIATPRGFTDGTFYNSGMLQDGITYYPSGEAKEYAFCDKHGKLDQWLPAQNVIHLFDPEFQYQSRGLTALTHCINDCRDMIQSTEWERLAMLQMSSISLVEYNDNGGPDLDDPFNALIGDTASCKGMTVESLDGGTVRYFRSNSGGKIETLVNNRPGNPFMDFHDRLLKSAFAGLNWSMALYSGQAAGGGTAQRTEIAMAQRSVEDRQDLLFYAAKRLCGYAVAKAMKRGDLPKAVDWYQWEFSTPPKLTIDDGRITKELEQLWKMGAANLRDIVSMRGKTLEAHYTERAQEVWLRKHYAHSVADALNATHGMKHFVEDREMSMLTPNETAGQPQTAVDGNEKQDNGNDERLRFENLKSKFDAYGVAVRAGAITPAQMDEETFRKEAGLPDMSPAIRDAWTEDKGIRRPITLAPSGGVKSPLQPQPDTSPDGDQP